MSSDETSMANTEEVQLELATPRDSELLANLLELYIYELSDVFSHLELGDSGRFGYEKLPLFFSNPVHRFPFFVRYRGKMAGFILATRGSPASDDPNVLDVTEFFVMRRWRRLGVGRRAASQLWDRMPGLWTVRVAEQNASALPFWVSTIAQYTGRDAVQLHAPNAVEAWRVFSFRSSSQKG